MRTKILVGALTTMAMLASASSSSAAGHAFLPQVRAHAGCLVKPGPHRPLPRLTLCGAQYTDAILAVNARRELYPVAVGIHRARHAPIEACRCSAGRVLQKAQQVATFTRRRFKDWWADPRTSAGRKLKGCLKNAALALGAYYAQYVITHKWDDEEMAWLVGVACGVGSVVDA